MEKNPVLLSGLFFPRLLNENPLAWYCFVEKIAMMMIMRTRTVHLER